MRPLWRAALAALALLAAFGAGFVWFLDEIPAGPAEPARRTDGIVVLTGGAERVRTGLDLLDAGLAPRLLVSGVAPGLTLGDLAAAHGRDPAALAGRVALGRAAATTVGNAAETAAWARANDLRSLRVVTAAYHMPRALVELDRALPTVALVPHAVVPATLAEVSLARAARLHIGEYVKLGLAMSGLSQLVPARDAQRR